MPLRAVRVCARTYPPRKASGRPGRWNAANEYVLYLAEHFSTALLESIVHAGAASPPPSQSVWVTIPESLVVDRVVASDLPAGWDDLDHLDAARAVGSRWYSRARSAILVVPSVPGRPYERNVVINTTHRDAARIRWGATKDVPWDPRLFG